jgi:hypothetical protein
MRGRGRIRAWEDVAVDAHLYLWKAPRDLTAEAAEELVATWLAESGDPAASPFEPSTDIGWAFRELTHDLPRLDAASDAPPDTKSRPIWLSTDDAPAARVIGVHLDEAWGTDALRQVLEEIIGLAAKYDLVLFERPRGRIHKPLEALEAEASATFWPGGAVRSIVVGVTGALIGIVAWSLGIPLLSGVVALIGLFLAVLAAATLLHEALAAGRRRG